jgi:hypothetical protein
VTLDQLFRPGQALGPIQLGMMLGVPRPLVAQAQASGNHESLDGSLLEYAE